MNIKQVVNGRTVKTVTIENVAGESADEIRELAYAAAHESQSSTFGTSINGVEGVPGVMVVKIYID